MAAQDSSHEHDFDFVIVGSGFGGSVAAHRLTEKGYRVAVLEQGKRYTTEDLPKTTWNLRKYLWAPKLGLKGILGITTFKDIVIFHGTGVGGGSLVYANTHLEPLDKFYTDPKWADLGEWREELAPFYAEAKRMLGTVEAPLLTESDEALQSVFEDLGQGHTFQKHTVGVYFGEAGERVPDPYFGGKGPDRVGCTLCGGCMVGCRIGAKNTLDKNYLYLAEQQGAQIFPETKVTDIQPLGAEDGSGGYAVHTRSTRGFLFKKRSRFTAKRVVLSAGVLGTVALLSRCKDRGSLPHLSDQLGNYVRTNSESIQGVVVRDRDVSKGIAITSGGHTKEGTHVEIFRYGDRADSMGYLSNVHVGGGRLPRQLYFLAAILRHPLQFLRQLLFPLGFSRGLAGVLAMQDSDTSMKLVYKRRWYWPFNKTITSDWGDRKPPPTYMPDVHDVTQRLAKKLGGEPGSILPEVVLNTTTTAHILGGCPMGSSSEDGVIDNHNRVFNYEGMYVVDGSMIPANLGVNPSLTITAMAERAMHHIPARHERRADGDPDTARAAA
jgi:cholesterol oxidase